MVETYLLGSTGRRPFAGHFRGRATLAGIQIAWAGRIGSGLSSIEAWESAEAVREALANWPGGHHRTDALEQVWLCLHRMERRWLERNDISVLFAAEDKEGPVLSACGLSMIHTRVGNSLKPLLPEDHALFSEPGLPEAPPIYYPTAPGPWIGQVHGSVLPSGEVDRLLGQPTASSRP